MMQTWVIVITTLTNCCYNQPHINDLTGIEVRTSCLPAQSCHLIGMCEVTPPACGLRNANKEGKRDSEEQQKVPEEKEDWSKERCLWLNVEQRENYIAEEGSTQNATKNRSGPQSHKIFISILYSYSL